MVWSRLDRSFSSTSNAETKRACAAQLGEKQGQPHLETGACSNCGVIEGNFVS